MKDLKGKLAPVTGATVGIQFCGGCNPRIDRGKIALELQKELVVTGFDVAFNNLDADIVIFLSGCPSGCAVKLNHKEPRIITVAGATVDGLELGEDLIVWEVIKRVGIIYERLKTNTARK